MSDHDGGAGASAAAQLHLANERTFLAQIRTGVAVMAFGFVVAKFALYLRDLGGHAAHPAHGADPVFGAILTGLGACVVAVGGLRYARRERSIREGHLATSPLLDLLLAGVLVAGGVGLAVYLAFQAA